MKDICTTIFFALLSIVTFAQENTKLFPIISNSLYGYIDSAGGIDIQPQFLAAGDFSEGFAAVRVNGRYGYINTSGKVVIAPEFDFASPFLGGYARVYLDSIPYIIDKSGKILFQHDYKIITELEENSLCRVVTSTKKHGAVNKKGELIIDTVYSNISPFVNGVAVVTGLNHNSNIWSEQENLTFEIGVMDRQGKWIVKFGEYKDISTFNYGYASVELMGKSLGQQENHLGIIDTNGRYKFTVPYKKWKFPYKADVFYNEMAIIDIFTVDPETIKIWSSANRYSHKGVINTDGKIVLSNPDWDELTPFHFNRAFALNISGQWILIDTKGRSVSTETFEEIQYEKFYDNPTTIFENGIAIIKNEEGWGAIDTNGNYVLKPSALKDLNISRIKRHGKMVIFFEDISFNDDSYTQECRIWNMKLNTLVQAQFDEIDMYNSPSDLIRIRKNQLIGYINMIGELVWLAEQETGTKNLNIDFMNRGYFYASSAYKEELAEFGGWAGSYNASQKISSGNRFSPNVLQIVIDTLQKTQWDKQYEAVKLFVANTSKDTMFFSAQDSRLYINMQAQDKNGNWRDVEYLPSSWCGNSYHFLFLAPNEYWEFSTPRYQGEFKTKMRAKLLYLHNTDQNEEDILYSNEIEGFINPGQFWNKLEYFPSGIMDPYFD